MRCGDATPGKARPKLSKARSTRFGAVFAQAEFFSHLGNCLFSK